jgi:SAM-dependent methyltransferase
MRALIKDLLRSLHLSSSAAALMDRLRYWGWAASFKNRNTGREKEVPDVPFPPRPLIWKALGRMSRRAFVKSGAETAAALTQVFQACGLLNSPVRILEWGCGPGRVIRPLGQCLGSKAELVGADCDAKTIRWCKSNLPDLSFFQCGELPPLPFGPDAFDACYCISVFTHLSSDRMTNWLTELARVLKPGGLLVFTTHGQAYQNDLTVADSRRLDEEGVVVKGLSREGHKLRAAYHRPAYILCLCKEKFRLEKHIQGGYLPHDPQDLWVFRRRPSVSREVCPDGFLPARVCAD